jgi:hypothetical protein
LAVSRKTTNYQLPPVFLEDIMDFGEILTRAWKIIWKHKILWLFGILASCGQGGGGGSGGSRGGGGNVNFDFSSGDPSIPPEWQRFFFQFERQLTRFFDQIETWHIVLFVVLIILFMLIVTAITLAVSTVGRVGLIQGTVQADQTDDELEKLTFVELFNSGKPFFWRVLGLNLLIGLAVFVLVLLIMLPVIALTVVTMGIGMFCLIPLICLLIPVGWLAGIIIQQVNIALVVEDLGIIESLQRGWEIFRENIGNLVVIGLILGVGRFIIGLIIAVPFILLFFPMMMGALLGGLAEVEFALGGGLLVAGLCFLAYLPVLWLLSGMLMAYIQAAWTLTYLRITQGPAKFEALDEPEDVEADEISQADDPEPA